MTTNNSNLVHKPEVQVFSTDNQLFVLKTNAVFEEWWYFALGDKEAIYLDPVY